MKRTIGIVACGLLLCGPAKASAQTTSSAPPPQVSWFHSGYLTVSGERQSGSRSEASSTTFSLYDETAEIDSTRTVSGSTGLAAEIGFGLSPTGMPYGDNLAVGISYFERTVNDPATITGSIPSPVFYNTFRSVSVTTGGLHHRETWATPFLAYGVPVAPKTDVIVLAGPSVVWVEHDLVTGATVSEGASGPQLSVATVREKKTVFGFLLGAEVVYEVAPRIGIQGNLRYTVAHANLADTKLTMGGFQVGGGIQVRFW